MVIRTIDLEDFPNGYEELRRASEEWGCFRVVNHGVQLSLMSDMKGVVRSLLDLPMEMKMRNTDTIEKSGYLGPTEFSPLYESLGLFDHGGSSPEALSSFFSQLSATHHQRETIEKHAEAVNGLAICVAGRVAESMGLSGGDLFQDWVLQFKMNKYSFSSEAVGSTGIRTHTDPGFLTVLQDDDNVGGLEVMDHRSGELVPVDPAPGAFLVILGDMARIWSNGRLCNLRHRVVCKEATVRVSNATFLLGPRGKAVEAPGELIDSHHPRLYRPVTYMELKQLRFAHLREGRQPTEMLYLKAITL